MPSTVSQRSLSAPKIEDRLDFATHTLAGDPFSSILLGGDLSLQPQELRANVRAALVGPGQVHILETGDKVSDIVGVAIWYPPGARAFARCVLG